MTFRAPALLAAVLAACVSLPAQSEKADRDKPMQLEAQRITVDDGNKVQILEGDVVLSKGTLQIQCDKIIVKEDAYGFQRGTAFGGKGGLARFRQKREGKDEYVEGEAERIEYDSRSEKAKLFNRAKVTSGGDQVTGHYIEYDTRSEVAELFHRAWIKSGEDQIKGDYIWYDSINEKYLVTAGETRDPKGPPPRVRAVITPQAKTPPPEESTTRRTDHLELKGAGTLEAPPQH